MFGRKKEKKQKGELIDRIREKIDKAESVGEKIPQAVKDLVKTGIDIAFPRVSKIIDAIKSLKEDKHVPPLLKEELVEMLEAIAQEDQQVTERMQIDNEHWLNRSVRPVLTYLFVANYVIDFFLKSLMVPWWHPTEIASQQLFALTMACVIFHFGGRTLFKDLGIGKSKIR